jgi:O-antigen/teichoic acid export membrane protein
MLISSFFGASVLGFYALSLRVLQVPVGIVGSALGQVLYQKFTIMYNNGEDLHHYVKKIVLFLFAISLVVFSFLYFIAPDLFAFVFGEKWRVAGEYSQILIPYLFMNFLISPISQLPIILDKQKTFFYFSLIGNSLFIISILLGQIYNIKVVLCLISVLMSLYYIFILYYLYNLLKKDLNVKKNKITNI